MCTHLHPLCTLTSPVELSVGFVYTLDVSEPREREAFYLAVPGDDTSLRFEFDINSNPRNQDVVVQLFLGRGMCVFLRYYASIFFLLPLSLYAYSISFPFLSLCSSLSSLSLSLPLFSSLLSSCVHILYLHCVFGLHVYVHMYHSLS